MNRKILISLRYKCSQCGEYFSVDGGMHDETFLDHSPLFIFRYFNDVEMHKCYGHVPNGKQRFYGLGKLVGWSWNYSSTTPDNTAQLGFV